jgi:hypothetical protein
VCPTNRLELGDGGGVVFQEARERVYRFGAELLGRRVQGGEVGQNKWGGGRSRSTGMMGSAHTRIKLGLFERGGEWHTHVLGGRIDLHGCANDR